MKKNFYIDLLFLFTIGVITSFSLPPFNYFLINFFTFTIFLIFLVKKLNNSESKKYFFYGWSFGLGLFISSLYWISISLTFDQSFKFLIPLSLILVPAFLAIFYGLVCLSFRLINPRGIINSLLVISLLFSIFEYLRGMILTGFPWNMIVYSLSGQLEILSITSIIGTYGLNLICITIFASPAILIMRRKKIDLLVFIFLLTLPSLFYFYGLNKKEKFFDTEKTIHNYNIRAIGSNISLDRFYFEVETSSIIEDLIDVSNPNKNNKTIFIWPEGIIPNIYQKDLKNYDFLFNKKFNENHLILIGINSKNFKNGYEIFFNSLGLYDYQLNLLDSYDKIKLVPFGEFLPFEKVLSKIGLKSITNNYQSYSKGSKRDNIEINFGIDTLKILPLICYEIIYSGNLFKSSDFDLIVNVSEDGWFGNSIGPDQHFTHSIYRAIESGKYLIRSSNNGIAAIINPLGIVEQSIGLGESGFVEFNESRKIKPTLFSRFGNKIFGFLILLYIFLIFSFNRIKNE